MKGRLVVALLALGAISLSFARSTEPGVANPSSLSSGVGAFHVDPGDGGTDCSHLYSVERGPWVPNYIDARGWICDKTVQCQAAASSVVVLTGPWFLAYGPAFDAAAGLDAACTVVSYSVGCHQEDRNYQDGYKRHVIEYTGYYNYDHCEKRILDDSWETQ